MTGDPPGPPNVATLFATFLTIGLLGFGGTLPWARRMLVEERGWLGEREFLEILSLSQLVPGPNIVNVCVTVGLRFFGAKGAVAAVAGLMAMPILIMLGLIVLYETYSELPAVAAAFRGVSSAAAGLLLAMAIKVAWPLRGSVRVVVLGGAVLVLVAVLRTPLTVVLAVMLPVSLVCVWRERRGR